MITNCKLLKIMMAIRDDDDEDNLQVEDDKRLRGYLGVECSKFTAMVTNS